MFIIIFICFCTLCRQLLNFYYKFNLLTILCMYYMYYNSDITIILCIKNLKVLFLDNIGTPSVVILFYQTSLLLQKLEGT